MTPPADAALRARVWGTLALAFHGAPPDETLARIDRLAQEARDGGNAALAAALAAWPADARCEAAGTVRQDFQDLFRVPTRKYVAAYESCHAAACAEAGNARPLPATFGPATASVQHFYRRVGLEPDPAYTELPDYIGLELACMEYLCVLEARHDPSLDAPGASAARAAQAEFMELHLARWVPALCRAIGQRASTRFHAGLARAMLAVTECEREELAQSPVATTGDASHGA